MMATGNLGRRLRAVIGFGAVVCLVAACGSSSSSSGGGSKKSYTIATTQDLSGATATLGKPVTAGIQTYFDYLNAQGGAGGHEIVLKVLDDAGDPTRGLTNVKQLLLDNPVGLVGNVSSAVSIPVQPKLDAAKVPQIMYTPVENLLADPDYFAVGLSSTDNYFIQAKYIQTLVGKKKPSVSTLILDSPAQVLARKAVDADMSAAGWTIGTNQIYEFGATSLTPEVQKVAAAHPDYIIGGFLDDVGPSILSGLKAAGVSAPVVNFSPGSSDSTFSAIASKQFLAVREFVSPSDVQSTGAALIRKEAAKYGTSGQANSVNFTKGWIIGMLYANAIQKCGNSCTGVTVRNALDADHNFSVGDLGPPIQFSPGSHAGTHSGRVFQWSAAKHAAVAVTPVITATKLVGG
jgi:branched-chain amino acid transport system substrate-binding protein